MNFLKLTKEDNTSVLVDIYNIALIDMHESTTVIHLYKGEDINVAETIQSVQTIIDDARANKV